MNTSIDANKVIENYKKKYNDLSHENVLLKTYVQSLEEQLQKALEKVQQLENPIVDKSESQ